MLKNYYRFLILSGLTTFFSIVFANPSYESTSVEKPYGMHICVATMPYMLYTEKNNNNRCEPTFSESEDAQTTLVDNFLVAGSKIVSLNHDEESPKKPSVMQDTPETWGSLSDVVYVDMVGNGFFP